MYKTLAPGAINTSPKDLPAAIHDAKIGGFAGLEVGGSGIADLVDGIGADAVKRMFAEAGIRPAAFGLPVEWRKTEDLWQRDLEKLPRVARAAAALGITRCSTWVMPASNERPLAENRRFHIERFKPIAAVLAQHNQRLGLEFIGPKTLRDAHKFEFIYRMHDMLDLGREIGPNVGLLLDCWHWYTSRGTIDDIRKLRAEDVVYVHVNDAPKGIEIDKQIDNVRCLPGETGVIDIAGFLNALKHIGYDGPVTPEPFKDELKTLPSDEARLQKVAEAMDKIFRQAGVG